MISIFVLFAYNLEYQFHLTLDFSTLDLSCVACQSQRFVVPTSTTAVFVSANYGLESHTSRGE